MARSINELSMIGNNLERKFREERGWEYCSQERPADSLNYNVKSHVNITSNLESKDQSMELQYACAANRMRKGEGYGSIQ